MSELSLSLSSLRLSKLVVGTEIQNYNKAIMMLEPSSKLKTSTLRNRRSVLLFCSFLPWLRALVWLSKHGVVALWHYSF